MRFPLDALPVFFLLFFVTPALAHPQSITDLSLASASTAQERAEDAFANTDISSLWKRKGGGGGGGKGGGGKGGGSSSSAGKGGSSSSSSSSSSSRGKGSPSSNTGGKTKQGSGVQPSYGGGRYYGGGSTTPYRSGLASPLGLSAILLTSTALAVFSGLWAYGAYEYIYHHPYTFLNQSASSPNGVNETKPIFCLCAQYEECGCDDNGNTTFLHSLVGNGSYAALNHSLIDVVDINGTSTIVLNGTLPNGTTTSGGSENANGALRILGASGYWVMIALVGCTVLLV